MLPYRSVIVTLPRIRLIVMLLCRSVKAILLLKTVIVIMLLYASDWTKLVSNTKKKENAVELKIIDAKTKDINDVGIIEVPDIIV